MGCCQGRPNVKNSVLTVNHQQKTNDGVRNSSVSTKKNSKAMEEIPEIQKDKVKEAKRDEPIKETSDVKPEQKSKTEPVQVPNKSEKLKEPLAKPIKDSQVYSIPENIKNNEETKTETHKIVNNENKKPSNNDHKTEIECKGSVNVPTVVTKESSKQKQTSPLNEQKDKNLCDIEDLSFNKKTKIDTQSKEIEKEPIKYELSSDGRLTQRDLDRDLQNNDEQGNLPNMSEERPSIKANAPQSLKSNNKEKVKTINFEEEKTLPSTISKFNNDQQQSTSKQIKDALNDTSVCISGIVHEYVGEVFDVALDHQLSDDEKVPLNTSIESSMTIKHTANNYIEEMINNLCDG